MRLYHIIFVGLFYCILSSCERTTTVTGTITDSATGLPLEGVKVNLVANLFKKKGFELVDSSIFVTGADGKYTVEIEGKKISQIFIRMGKPYYFSPEEIYLKKGDCKVFDKKLNPLDAYLAFTVINETQADELFCFVGGNLYEGNLQIGPGGKGSDIPSTFLLRVAGGDFVRIYWDSKLSNLIDKASHVDSIFCPRNDTTQFLLKF